MKEFSPLDLQASQGCASIPSGFSLPRFEAWLADRPELWNAGGGIQREMFVETLRARIAD